MSSGSPLPRSLLVLMVALLLQGLSGVVGGLALVFDPTGGSLGIPLALLSDSPFDDYLAPGVVLSTVLGLVPLLTFHGCQRGRRWSWYLSVVVGVALLCWIGVQIAMIGYQHDPPLQLVYAGLGVIIVVAALLPSTRRELLCREHAANQAGHET